MPTPTKGPRLGGGPAHERLMLANLATSLFEHDPRDKAPCITPIAKNPAAAKDWRCVALTSRTKRKRVHLDTTTRMAMHPDLSGAPQSGVRTDPQISERDHAPPSDLGAKRYIRSNDRAL